MKNLLYNYSGNTLPPTSSNEITLFISDIDTITSSNIGMLPPEVIILFYAIICNRYRVHGWVKQTAKGDYLYKVIVVSIKYDSQKDNQIIIIS